MCSKSLFTRSKHKLRVCYCLSVQFPSGLRSCILLFTLLWPLAFSWSLNISFHKCAGAALALALARLVTCVFLMGLWWISPVFISHLLIFWKNTFICQPGELSAASWTHRRPVKNKDVIQRDIFVGQVYTLASTLRRRCSTATAISQVFSNNEQLSVQNNSYTCIRSICILSVV